MNTQNAKLKARSFWLIVAVVVVLDQLTKFFIRNNLAVGQSKPILQNIFHLTYVQNTGVAFGLFKGMNWLFIIVAIVAIGIVLYYYKQIVQKSWLANACGLILGGAIGNVIDRILLGFVVDFLDFRIWPAFNLADSALTIGVIGLIMYGWKK